MSYLLTAALFLIFSHSLPGQASIEPAQVYTTTRIESSILVDGQLDEAAWADAAVATDFIEFEPSNGNPPRQRSEVRILYDDNALYVGAMLFDESPDSILRQLGPRDVGENNADLFGIILDTYDDDQNAFGFYVSAAGVQSDTRFSRGGEDIVWDAVWKSAVSITEEGWVAEMEIPFSAIRFANTDEQHWGMQLYRVIRRHRQRLTWNFADRAVEGWVNQFGQLEGIHSIKPPLRLSITPYVSGYLERSTDKGIFSDGHTGFRAAGGMDLKLGLSDAFTLDMTLIPDFGQVQSDNQVLNLSPFEVLYQERRPFFTEGIELFNTADIFYSRRVGGLPRGYTDAYQDLAEGEAVVSNPTETRLLNATKISGRTSGRLGLGFFNAVSAATQAEVADSNGNIREVTTQPLTNYNVSVVDQALPNNGNLSLINTNRYQLDGSYMANVTAGRFRLATRGNRWFVEGGGAYSLQAPEAGENNSGFAYDYAFGKASGNFTYNFRQSLMSDGYDINDMGYLNINNQVSNQLTFQYAHYKPWWKFIFMNYKFQVYQASLYRPSTFRHIGFSYNSWMQTRDFTFYGLNAYITPIQETDFFEARVFGRPFNVPASYQFGGFISTNYAKRFALDMNAGLSHIPVWDQVAWWLGISPRFRVNDKLSFVHNTSYNRTRKDKGFVAFDNDGTSIIGTRFRRDIVNTFSTTYSFTNRLSMTLRVRHYWSVVRYDWYQRLQDDGELGQVVDPGDADVNFNIFNIDSWLTWRFAPGSDIILTYKNSIGAANTQVYTGFAENLFGTFGSPQVNSLSLRVLWYLDYGMLRRRLRKN